MRILIYGCGLIGGSIAKSLALQGFDVFAIDKSPLKFDAITFCTSIDKIKNVHFDVICVAVPRGKNFEIYQEAFQVVSTLSCDFIVDCSSVQGQNEHFREHLRGKFIPCHPIAGSEKVGFENSDAKILNDKTCIVIGVNPPQKVLEFWELCGMKTQIVETVQHHDAIYAAVSHLPQLLSFFLPEQRKPYQGFYRLKNSSREIWDEIFSHNNSNVRTSLLRFMKFLEENVKIYTDEKYPLEKIISDVFLKITPIEVVQTFAGTGFATITSCANIPNGDTSEVESVRKILSLALKNLEVINN